MTGCSHEHAPAPRTAPAGHCPGTNAPQATGRPACAHSGRARAPAAAPRGRTLALPLTRAAAAPIIAAHMEVSMFRVRMIATLLSLCLLPMLGLACGGGGAADMSDPRSVATAALNAYKAKDIGALAKLVPANEAEKAKSADTAKMFADDNWRMKAAVAWNGSLGAARQKGDRMRIHFHDMSDKEVAVVSLEQKDGKWYFDGIKSPDKADFESWGEVVK